MSDPMAVFREKFRQRCAVDRERLVHALEAWRQGDANAHGELVAIIHGLAGAGGTFGFSSLSDHAMEAEARLLDTTSHDSAIHGELINGLLEELSGIEAGEIPPK